MNLKLAIREFFTARESTSFDGVSLSGANNLFGSIANSSLFPAGDFGFIPLDAEGATLNLQDPNAQAKWLGLSSRSMQYWAYQFCSPLAGVIDRLAQADSNGKFEFVNEDGETLKNANKNPRLLRIKTLVNKPNPWQTREEWESEQVVLAKIFGYCPVWAIGPAGMDKSYSSIMVNLNPFFCLPEYNYNFDLLSGDIVATQIKCWRITILGKSYSIPAEDVLLVKDGFIDAPSTPGLPLSKIAGLDFWVSNICAAMEADNVLLKKKGPLGVFSFDPKPDMAGQTPMNPTQKKEVQDDLARYGMTLGQLQYIVSRIPIKWNPMSFNVQELMTKDTTRQGIDGICDRFDYPAELMSGKNATYENRTSAEKFLYQNNIIPFSLRRMSRYNRFFGLESSLLSRDFDHLPVLQEDILKSGQSRQAKSLSVQTDWMGGLITWNEARMLLEQDTVIGMDIYYNEYLKKYPPPVQTKPKKLLNAA